jgi:large subunit ribosomal protein L21
MYAIVKIGGKQYRAEVGRNLVVEKLPYEVGQQIELNEVLMLSDGDQIRLGQPYLGDISVNAEIIDQFRGKKVVIFKYKPKIRYRRKQGHRQLYTRLLVHSIGAGEGGATQPEAPKARTRKKSE